MIYYPKGLWKANAYIRLAVSIICIARFLMLSFVEEPTRDQYFFWKTLIYLALGVILLYFVLNEFITKYKCKKLHKQMISEIENNRKVFCGFVCFKGNFYLTSEGFEFYEVKGIMPIRFKDSKNFYIKYSDIKKIQAYSGKNESLSDAILIIISDGEWIFKQCLGNKEAALEFQKCYEKLVTEKTQIEEN